jgi:prepilin-type N-terminal cleavage/methylation domain-containing protein
MRYSSSDQALKWTFSCPSVWEAGTLMHLHSPRRRAYTLLELVLVTALIGILAALSYPAIDGAYNHYRMDAGIDAVRAAWAEAKARSVSDGIPYRFSVVMGKGNFRLAPDLPEFWEGNAPADGMLVREGTLPKGITFGTADSQVGPDENTSLQEVSAFQYTPVAVFRTDAFASMSRVPDPVRCSCAP